MDTYFRVSSIDTGPYQPNTYVRYQTEACQQPDQSKNDLFEVPILFYASGTANVEINGYNPIQPMAIASSLEL